MTLPERKRDMTGKTLYPTMRKEMTPRERIVDASRRLAERLGAEQEAYTLAGGARAERREQSEIVWFPHTGAWGRLQQGAPLLFWTTAERATGRSTSAPPLIAVPLDGHRHAERAIPLACSLAEMTGAEVVLLYVAQRPPCGERRAALRAVREGRGYLREARERAVARAAVPIRTKLLLGEPGATLVAFATRPLVGAFVLTTHGQMRHNHFFAGSVATQVVRQTHIPVLLVPLGPEEEH